MNPLLFALHLTSLVAALWSLNAAGTLRVALLRASRARLTRDPKDRAPMRARALAMRILERPRAALWRLLGARSAIEVISIVFLAGTLRATGLSPAAVFGATLFFGVILLHVFGDVLPGRATHGEAETLLLRAGFWGRLLDPNRPLFAIDRLAAAFVGRLGHVLSRPPTQAAALLRMIEVDATLWGETQGVLPGLVRFHSLLAGDVMVPAARAIAVEERTTVREVLALFRKHAIARLPVHRGGIGTVVGVVHARDLYLRAFDRDALAKPVSVFQREAYFVPSSKPLRDLLAEFRRERAFLAVVLDDYGRTLGFVTLEDVLRSLFGEIPE